MFRTPKIQKNILVLVGLLSLSYVIIFLLAPKDIADYTVADTEYWRETENRLLLKTAYEYNNKEDIQAFPKTLGDWNSIDFKYPDYVYTKLNADILLSRAYTRGKDLVWMDIINSKVGESFHKQKICVEGSGWKVVNESISMFTIVGNPSYIPFTKLYANRLDITKQNKSQVIIYWFMFKKFGSSDAVTMIRLSSPVNSNETTTFNSIKRFVEDQLFNAMYKRAESKTITVAEQIIKEYGKIGIFGIMMIVLVPIGLVFLGLKGQR